MLFQLEDLKRILEFFLSWLKVPLNTMQYLGGVQNLEWSNVEQPIFQNFKITNIRIANDGLFDYFIYEFISYYYFFQLLEHSKYLIIFPNHKIF